MVLMSLIFSIIAGLNLELHHVDIETAFLYGDLDEVYMEQPPHFVSLTIPQYVCKLHKSLYGLKQSFQIGLLYKRIDEASVEKNRW